MTTFAVLATGPSMSQVVADSVRHLRCVAVNDAFRLAPWAEALAAQDPGWWLENPDAFDFAGDKYSCTALPGLTWVGQTEGISTQSSSGLLGLHVAIDRGAEHVILLGFDFHGSHYFGEHLEPLSRTTAERFEEFERQFQAYPLHGVTVVNATPSSRLNRFPCVGMSVASLLPAA